MISGLDDKMNDFIDVMIERCLDVLCVMESKRKGSDVPMSSPMACWLCGLVCHRVSMQKRVGVMLSSRLASGV